MFLIVTFLSTSISLSTRYVIKMKKRNCSSQFRKMTKFTTLSTFFEAKMK